MLLTRTFEEKLASMYRGGRITGGVYIGKGQEAVSVACGIFLQKGDIFAPLIRDQAGRSAFGEPLVDVARTYLGSRAGPMRGRDGNIHRGKPRDGQLAMISHLGAMVSVVVGSLMAKRGRGEKNFIGLTTIGEGGMQTGATHEGMNIAAVEHVPLVVVAIIITPIPLRTIASLPVPTWSIAPAVTASKAMNWTAPTWHNALR